MLVLVGTNHRSAPVAVRERMSFPLQALPEAHQTLLSADGIEEGMILSTCNRVEILVRAAGEAGSTIDVVKSFLAREQNLSGDEVDKYTYQLVGDDAIRHLFSVASGLDSMIMGEPQILGQVKQAYQMGKEQRTIGPVLDRLLQHCLSTAKKVRTDTGISRNAVSVAYAAVELARKIFGDLDGRSAMLLGAGEMGDLVGRHLASNGAGELIVCSRTFTNAVLRAQAMGGKAINWEEALNQLRKVDILVSCTGASHTVLTKKDVAGAMRGRRIGPLFLIDIAVPRDIDPRVNELDNVYLYDIDALQGVIDANKDERRRAAEHAKRMIGDEVISFDRWRQSQEVTPLIVSLRETLLGVGENELERHRNKLGTLDEKQQRAVEELTRGIIQKILHRPIRRLRASVDRGDMLQCTSLYREIFGVEPSGEQEQEPAPGPRHEVSETGAQDQPSGSVDGGQKGG